jgi:DNA-binding NtrC family response regulator
MEVKNIFVVEDDEFFAEVFIKKLRKMGDFEIHYFLAVEPALSQTTKIRPEIIFLDHVLHGLRGVDAIPLFKEIHESTEIVIVSNQTSPEVLGRALDFGATKYFQKDLLLTNATKDFIEELKNRESKHLSFWSHFWKFFIKNHKKT